MSRRTFFRESWPFAALAALLVAGAAFAQEGPSATPTPRPAEGRRPPLGGGVTREPQPTPRPGSSLADIVRQSQEKEPGEGKKKRSLGVITNDSLKQPGTEGTAPKGKAGAAPAPPKKTIATPFAPPPPEPKDSKGRTEADWKNLVVRSHQRVQAAEAEVRRLEAEHRRLEADYYAWSDGNYRERVIKPSWDQARDDLKKARLEADQARAAVADLEDEARKSGAPPGWLR